MGGSACNGFSSHWAHEVDPLRKMFEEPGNYIKNQRNKGNAGIKCHKYLGR